MSDLHVFASAALRRQPYLHERLRCLGCSVRPRISSRAHSSNSLAAMEK
jgi:hypothetical protein